MLFRAMAMQSYYKISGLNIKIIEKEEKAKNLILYTAGQKDGTVPT